MEITDDYLGLGQDITKCQNMESYDDCTTRKYIETVKEKCNCIPFAMKYFLNATMVSFK